MDKITLIAYADNGCIDTTSKIIHVFNPEGKFTADKNSGCIPGLHVKFTDTSSDSTIKYWIWNYGDGSSSDTNKLSVSHDYSSLVQKTFVASLTVYDEHLCSSKNSIPISLEKVVADFQADDNAVCVGQKITFMPRDNSLDSMIWNFGDNASSSSNPAFRSGPCGNGALRCQCS